MFLISALFAEIKMKVSVQVFAAAKDIVGSPEIEIEVPDECNIESLKTLIEQEHPDLKSLMHRANFAVNHSYVPDDFQLQADHEIAFIPPVSGG